MPHFREKNMDNGHDIRSFKRWIIEITFKILFKKTDNYKTEINCSAFEGFLCLENDDNGFQSVVELEQMFPTQVQHNSVQSVLPE